MDRNWWQAWRARTLFRRGQRRVVLVVRICVTGIVYQDLNLLRHERLSPPGSPSSRCRFQERAVVQLGGRRWPPPRGLFPSESGLGGCLSVDVGFRSMDVYGFVGPCATSRSWRALYWSASPLPAARGRSARLWRSAASLRSCSVASRRAFIVCQALQRYRGSSGFFSAPDNLFRRRRRLEQPSVDIVFLVGVLRLDRDEDFLRRYLCAHVEMELLLLGRGAG